MSKTDSTENANIPTFVLASASPARKKLLQTAGIEPLICKSDFDESQVQTSDPIELVQTLALSKAKTVIDRFEDSLILGCDSVLAIAGEIHGKPKSPQHAIARWQKMRGNMGTLYTGHALIDQTQTQHILRCGITKVYFTQASDRAIEAYVASGEPLNCAGCFALDGKGGLFIEKLEGCHSNVIGLSLPLLHQMLIELGYDIADFWQSAKI
ncbi:septum formation inhibitor Maf [Lusitaniella coriacea LEGE 07157]|uniref:Nucleoside triphosphate pyrophosphatase n=1 Tax=Lusitaniella coriacea LEGE 07157 TaxID=945747 RepID=A0A8J7DZR9_9CYAN|nr:nucleoside triphosphate pyrophosphatase [Lusitaniella coriacea]MBE9118310.1 septum formation inhibitor Maf [Lusitaniella coriacea LEGE 07157]